MFKRLIQTLTGKSSRTEPPAPPRPEPRPAATPSQPELITVYDVHGRELQVTRADWRDKMLLPQLEAKWNEPDALYQVILNALNDGFLTEVAPASERLLQIDPIIERSHVVHAIVLMKRGALDAAERVLRDAATQVGETGAILTNLAKVQEARGDEAQAGATLWKAVTLDPNLDNGLGWWLARETERDGEAAYLAALERAAALPGSWRATLYLGRHRLAAGDLPAALGLFQAVLAKAPHAHDVLLTISGELGNAGKLDELVKFTGPHYDAAVHGPAVGMNLLQAYLQLGRLDEGEALLGRLYALQLSPYKQHLDAMAGQFQDRRREATASRPVEESSLELGQLGFDRPIWMYGLRDPDWLFVPKAPDARKVAFLMFGATRSGIEQAEEQREDDVGRLSRAIPLYLAESVHEWTASQAHSLVAVAMGGGPVVFGAQDEAQERDTAAQLASLADVLVIGAIGKSDERWEIRLGFWDTGRAELMGRESISASTEGLEAAVLELEAKVLARLGGTTPKPHDSLYARPTLEQIQPHLNAVAQSLMLNLVANNVVPRDAMWGERNMLEWPLRMALHWPTHQVAGAMYLSGISHAARYGSDVLPEFEERSFDWLRGLEAAKAPLAELAPLLLHAFKRTDGIAAVRRDTNNAQRLAWLERVTAA